MSLSTRSLFGGALSISIAPELLDVSDFRQVPDTQEVFVCSENDDSLIIELVEMLEGEDLSCAKQHYNLISEENEAQDVVIESVKELNKLASISSLKHAIRSEYTKVNGNKYWERLLKTCYSEKDAISATQNKQLLPGNFLSYIENKVKYEFLVKKYSHKLSQKEQLSRTAKLVGLQLPAEN
ncbi:hypothetical protein BB561_000286 [Smittium simulii]|uniref:Uncharacterized protein n=1 Tax=Smittium simulii TaxID=133385 RepID=A0A2T9YZT8_9FUNG|nr:hypothetical protein BB561_000286 [Smittium simulii]